MLSSIHHRKNHNKFTTVEGLRVLCEPDHVYELRCQKTTKHGTISGYFSDVETMARCADRLSGIVPAVWITLNPVKPELIKRAPNGVSRRASTTTADHEVLRRRRLLLDFDPIRPSGISSTEEEHNAALVRARDCREWLTRQGFPEPILADSGNGGHLVYGLDLPNDAASLTLLENFLRALAARFSGPQVELDSSVCNASRLTKIYGTKACKGDDLPDRPHRWSAILDAPERLQPVPQELLARLAHSPTTARTVTVSGGVDPAAIEAELRRLDATSPNLVTVAWVEEFLDRHGIGVRQVKESNGQWQRRWILERCPFCGSEDRAATVTLDQAGKIGYRCQHNRCTNPRRHWSDFRRYYEPDQPANPDGKQGRLARLIEYATTNCHLALDGDSEEALARIPGLGWRPVECKTFRTWLVDSFRQATGQIVRGADLADALLNVAAACRDRHKAYHRVTRLDDAIYLDLCRGDGKAIQITAEGWKVLDEPPVVFLTKKDMAALPLPKEGGSIDELREIVNVTKDDFRLYLGWLLDALKGRKPYSVLVVNGEQGSGKSTFSSLSTDLIDPCCVAKTKNLPRNLRDLAVLASNRHLLAFDNLSWLSEAMSDALCRLATGSGMVVRSLYSNAEEQVFGGARPVLLNGIPEIGDRSDFLGRTVKITLRAIPEDKRLGEKALMSRFEARRPYLLGALCSLLANGLKYEGTVSAEKMPRMADSFLWLKACEAGTGWKLADGFADNLRENVKGLALETLLGRSLVNFVRENTKQQVWHGPANELHDGLRVYWDRACGESQKEKAKYPGNARALSGRLTELTASLRENGIVVEKGRTGAGRAITIDARGHFPKSDMAGSGSA